MKIILTESVERLGGPGDQVTVRDGFARNFLLPQGKALRDSPDNRALYESRRAVYEERNQGLRKKADERAAALQGTTLVLIRQATESGHLYGSVTARDVAEVLSERGEAVARSEVSLERAIKQTGLYSVRLRLHAEVQAEMTLNVAGNEAQAKENVKAREEGTEKKSEAQEAESASPPPESAPEPSGATPSGETEETSADSPPPL